MNEDIQMYPVVDEHTRNYIDDILKALEAGKKERGKDALKNAHVALSKLKEEDINYINEKLRMLDYCISGCYRTVTDITPFEAYALEIERIQIFANMRRAEKGFFADLLLKHHQVVQSLQHEEERRRKTWLQRLLGV